VVDTVNVALLCPERRVMLAGTIAAVLLLCRVTTVPVDGATAFRVAVPVDVFPPPTVDGFSVRVESTRGSTVKTAEAVALNVAVSVATVEADTA
jgi:hypothetical protein